MSGPDPVVVVVEAELVEAELVEAELVDVSDLLGPDGTAAFDRARDDDDGGLALFESLYRRTLHAESRPRVGPRAYVLVCEGPYMHSVLSPEQARWLAGQLTAAADEVEGSASYSSDALELTGTDGS